MLRAWSRALLTEKPHEWTISRRELRRADGMQGGWRACYVPVIHSVLWHPHIFTFRHLP